jgi:hypothetical protein
MFFYCIFMTTCNIHSYLFNYLKGSRNVFLALTLRKRGLEEPTFLNEISRECHGKDKVLFATKSITVLGTTQLHV